MSFKKNIQRTGGIRVLFNYIRYNIFLSPLMNFLLLGSTKKSLELIRLVIQYKVQKRLKQEFKPILNSNRFDFIDSDEKNYNIEGMPVWFCWLQGIDQAPELVKKCLQSLSKNLSSNQTIYLITSDNYGDYVKMPEFLISKWEKGVISKTHFSDIMRLYLLYSHGGIWVDSTVYFSSKIPDYVLNSDLFLFQNLKPGLNGSVLRVSSWFIKSKPKNIIIEESIILIEAYWAKKNFLVDYHLVHHFISISFEKNLEELKRMPRVPNSLSHILLLSMNEEFLQSSFDFWMNIIFCHKLSNKIDKPLKSSKYTYLDHILKKK